MPMEVITKIKGLFRFSTEENYLKNQFFDKQFFTDAGYGSNGFKIIVLQLLTGLNRTSL